MQSSGSWKNIYEQPRPFDFKFCSVCYVNMEYGLAQNPLWTVDDKFLWKIIDNENSVATNAFKLINNRVKEEKEKTLFFGKIGFWNCLIIEKTLRIKKASYF